MISAVGATALPLVSLALRGAFELGNVELHHLHHRCEDALAARFVRARRQLEEATRHDLPGDAELVLEPTALALLAAAREQALPVVVDLRLVLAVDDEGDGFVELKMRTAVERGELLAVELERDGHDGAAFAGTAFGIALRCGDLRALEDRHVMVRGLFGLVVVPEHG